MGLPGEPDCPLFSHPTISSKDQATALNDEQDLQGLAFGGGLMYATEGIDLGFDYAYKYLGILGATNFFTLSVGW